MFPLFFLSLFLSFSAHSAPFIIRGEDATMVEFPWQVSLQNRDGHVCGGSIISSRYILTAAHCLIIPDLEVYGGGDGSVWKLKTIGKIKNKSIHKEWQRTRKLNDIGLLEMEEDIAFSEDIAPISLLEGHEFKPNMKGVITGFGVTVDPNIDREIVFPKKLQKAELVLGPELGNSRFWSSQLYNYYSEKYDEYGSYAIADLPKKRPEERKGGCYADSGGPLVVKSKSGKYLLAGVVSKLINHCGHSTVFTFVPAHSKWIENITSTLPRFPLR